MSDDNKVKLQEFLNKCIEKGWKPRYYRLKEGQEIVSTRIIGGDEEDQFFAEVCLHYANNYNYSHSINDLFSKDSGLMEFVERDIIVEDMKLGDKYIQGTDPIYHYMIMGPMTSDGKIQYFLDNAVLPQ